MKTRIRSTHVHDNNGKEDIHLFPFLSEGGTIDWKKTMQLLRSRGDQFPLLLELKERPEVTNPKVIGGFLALFHRHETPAILFNSGRMSARRTLNGRRGGRRRGRSVPFQSND